MEANIINSEQYRIDPLLELSEPPTYCMINNRPSLTACNFSLINGKKKAGKTFRLGGVVASVVNSSTQLDLSLIDVYIIRNKAYYFFNFRVL